MHRAWWLGLSGAERALWWLRRMQLVHQLRYDLLQRAHPAAPDHAIRALWVEMTYRDHTDPEYLKRVVAAMRAGEETLGRELSRK